MTLKIGDRVRIEPLTDREKRYYPHSWSYRMDQYVGRVTRITDILINDESKIYVLSCDNGKWAWSDQNLVLVREKIALF